MNANNTSFNNNNVSVEMPLHQNAKSNNKFSVSKQNLIDIVIKNQQREFADEIDLLEKSYGDKILEEGLNTSFKTGIVNEPDDLKEREEFYGSNIKPKVKPKSIFELLCCALEDFILRILIFCSFISITLSLATSTDEDRSKAWTEGFAIFVAVVVCATVQAVNDYQKELQFQKLNNVADKQKQVTVIRSGKAINLHHSMVLVGDLVQIYEGMEIPADGYVIESAEIAVDESAMTGETDPIKKDVLSESIKRRDQIIEEGTKNTISNHDVFSPILLSGTRILTGEGKFIVVVVGENSCVGRINALLRQTEPEATPLQEKLEKIARDIGKFGLVSAILVVSILCLRFLIDRTTQGEWDADKHWNELLNYFILGITVIVVAIPEGLPLSVTISLAYSVKKMLKDNNLVRKLQACETMGGANMICSDKTGTLTQNKMTLTTIWNEKFIDLETYGKNLNISNYIPAPLIETFIYSFACNTSAVLFPESKGSKTDVSLLEFLERYQINYETYRTKFTYTLKFPFNSSRKRMTVAIKVADDKILMLTKGASELVLEACSRFHSFEGPIEIVDEILKKKIEKSIESMASRALRTIVLAYKYLDGSEDITTKDDKGVFKVEKHDLILLGVCGIKDILRQEVTKAVAQCKIAGIKVRMVTGDNKITARAIAKECGIIEQGDENSIVMEGVEFNKLIGGVICLNCSKKECECNRDQAKGESKKSRIDTIACSEEFNKLYPHLDVLARSRPEDKYALVTGLKERGHVVAVTGDGTNDAPALKKADVGFAMGISGTEVAREASAIILMDDNFNSIVKAVIWGRNIYDSIQKFLMFQLTVNIVAVFCTLIGAAILKQEIFAPIQMIWINLIMDSLASLALATEDPHEGLLNRKPHDRNEYIISKKMFKHVLGQSFYQFIIILLLVFGTPTFIHEYEDELDDIIRYQYGGNWDIKYNMDYYPETLMIRNGILKNINDGNSDYDDYQKLTPSRHFTLVFNTFVFLQVFNFVNARKLQDELNVFQGIHKNLMFLIILFIIVVLQVIFITFGKEGVHCYIFYGLTANQWLISVAFGAGGLIWSVFLKFIPENRCFEFGNKRADPLHTHSQVLDLKRSHNDSYNKKFSYNNLLRNGSANNNYHGNSEVEKLN